MKTKRYLIGAAAFTLLLSSLATPVLAHELGSLPSYRLENPTPEHNPATISAEIAKQQQIISSAQAVINNADKAVKDQLAKGSIGFFKQMGSTNAAAIFENKSYYQWNSSLFGREDHAGDPKKDYLERATEVGNPKDATSLENMYTSITYAVEANRLRKELGLSELKINDNLTAAAQRNANWSSYATYHADNVQLTSFTPSPNYQEKSFLFSTWGENLAWGSRYTGVSNPHLNPGTASASPFYGWVYQERDNVWEEEIAQKQDLDGDGIIGPTKGWQRKENYSSWNRQTGHYYNFITKQFNLMGLATSLKDNAYGNCVALRLAGPLLSSVQDPGNTAYTPAEYKQRLDNYVSSVRNSASAKVNQAKQDIKTAQEKIAALTSQLSFIDISDYPFITEIEWLAATKVTTGYPDRTFRPHDSVSRAAMAAFLYRLEGKPDYKAPAKSPFTDIKPGDDFYKEICWLASKGITTGYADKSFKPWDSISREAMAAFLHRYDQKVAAKKLATKLAAKKFTDTAATPFAKDIAWLSSTGVTTGYADGSFKPYDPIERGAIAAFFYRMKH